MSVVPTKRKGPNGTRYNWKCPAHVDTEIGKFRDPPVDPSGRGPKPPAMRPYRVRKLKNPVIRDIGLRRGGRNNGFIEIVNDDTEEEDAIDNEVASNIFRVPELSIKLDFAQRVRE